MLSIIIYLIGPVAVSISITGDEVQLPFGDINVLAVTDVHAWVAGHAPHEPLYDADYGDILSFYERVQSLLACKIAQMDFWLLTVARCRPRETSDCKTGQVYRRSSQEGV